MSDQKLTWTPEGGGYCAEAPNGWIFSMSRPQGPLSLSYHTGDGNWIQSGRFDTPSDAADAAENLLAINA